MTRTATFALFFIALTASAAPIEKVTFNSGGHARVYYLFVPERVPGSAPMPLIVTAHGSGRDGRILLEHWQKLAQSEGIVIAGPDATDSRGWQMPADGPDFIRDVVNDVKTRASIDPRRMYMFGHSAGGGFGLQMAMLQSRYFAAVAVHAGALDPHDYNIAGYAKRKIPIFMVIGTNDRNFPLDYVRATRDALQKEEIPVELWEIPRHTHDYYGSSRQINERVWQFLSKYTLDSDPQYTQYQ